MLVRVSDLFKIENLVLYSLKIDFIHIYHVFYFGIYYQIFGDVLIKQVLIK